MKWRAHIVMHKGYYRVFYRCPGFDGHIASLGERPVAYTADQVPFSRRRSITGPAIEFATALNARRHSHPALNTKRTDER